MDWLIDWLRGYGGTPSSDQLLSQLIPVTGKVASKTILFSHYLGMGQFFFLVKHAYFEKRNWLVVYLPLWKMEFVSWDSQYMGKMFQTTNQGCLMLKSRPKVILQSLQFWPIPHFCVRRATPWSWPWSGRSRLRYTGSGNTRLWIRDGHICHMEWAVSPWTRGGKIRELAILDWGYVGYEKPAIVGTNEEIQYDPGRIHQAFWDLILLHPLMRLHLWDEEEIFSSPSSQLKEAFQYMGSHPLWGYQLDPSCTEDDWKKPLIVGQSLGDLTISARRNKESVSKGSCSSVSGTPHKMCFESMALLESPAANSSFLWAANL